MERCEIRSFQNRNLLKNLGNPHEKLKFIHIAGTDGKGSTAAMMSSILIESGYNVGLFISPFINIFNERIQINNKYIKNEELAKITYQIKTVIDQMVKDGLEHPREFDIITAIGFLYFFTKKM